MTEQIPHAVRLAQSKSIPIKSILGYLALNEVGHTTMTQPQDVAKRFQLAASLTRFMPEHFKGPTTEAFYQTVAQKLVVMKQTQEVQVMTRALTKLRQYRGVEL